MLSTETVRGDRIAVGDQITEVDTPEGPFYRVVSRTPQTLTFTSDPIDEPDPLLVRVRAGSNCVLLRVAS